MCAAKMASVELNMARNSASDTPAPSAISAKPICSIGFSASSVMKAAMTRSRGDLLPPDAAAGCGLEALRDVRVEDREGVGLRAMTGSSTELI